MTPIRLSSEPTGSSDDVDAIENRIDTFNMRTTGYSVYHPVRIYLRDESGALCGGIIAHIWGGWLYIEFLYVDEPMRKQGFGAQLLAAAEDEARGYGCRNAHVGTYSFQARPFYERYGYQVISELEDYPPGHSHYHLRKAL
ncbi:MAG: GNAT family N-acetyltransferase [Anaerolineae bacterium]|nr:GNAT family N-acetyltransferase [Anaerolineae bacterium]